MEKSTMVGLSPSTKGRSVRCLSTIENAPSLTSRKTEQPDVRAKGSTNFEIDASHSSPWASYYLRDDQIVIQSRSLLYYLSPDPTREPYASRLKSAGILVTDAGSGFGTTPIWSNSHYSVYSVGRAEANATPR
jgi:hypothetical protein